MVVNIRFHAKPERILTKVTKVEFFCDTKHHALPATLDVHYDARSLDGGTVIPVMESFHVVDINYYWVTE
jgi:hypothetical protein